MKKSCDNCNGMARPTMTLCEDCITWGQNSVRKQTLKEVLEKYQKTNEYTLGERVDKLEDFEEWLEKEIKKLEKGEA